MPTVTVLGAQILSGDRAAARKYLALHDANLLRDLSKRLGVSRQTLARWRRASIATLERAE